MVSIYLIAAYFCSQSKPGTMRKMTHLKLQKLVYYAQAYSLAIKNTPMFDERIEAWDHGPVSPDLYARFKEYYYYEIPHCKKPDLPEGMETILNKVWLAFGCYDGQTLEQFTHEEKPWQDARKIAREKNRRHVIITQESIRDYFRSVLIRGR